MITIDTLENIFARLAVAAAGTLKVKSVELHYPSLEIVVEEIQDLEGRLAFYEALYKAFAAESVGIFYQIETNDVYLQFDVSCHE